MPSPDGVVWRCERCGRALGEWRGGVMRLLGQQVALTDNVALVTCDNPCCRHTNVWALGVDKIREMRYYGDVADNSVK